jgi:uncharacterized coiled-coil DUF342 family protein
MTGHMDSSTIALIFTGISLAVVLGKDLFGGGSKLASRFGALEKDTTEKYNALRFEFVEKNATAASNSKVGFEAITANIHSLQLGFSDFRAQMAENYMRRDSFYKATDDLKRDFNDKHSELKADVHRGFEEMKEQMNHLAQSIEEGRKTKSF